MQFVPGYREQNAPRRTPAATAAPSTTTTKTATVKEDTSCCKTSEPAKGSTTAPVRIDSTVSMPKPAPSGTAGTSSSSSLQAEIRDTLTTTLGADGSTTTIRSHSESSHQQSVLNQSNAALMGDAPACDVCGSITVRNGTCYKCLNCGNSMGCS
jgi:ribonucleoside-diphosphate reductase alpha chain